MTTRKLEYHPTGAQVLKEPMPHLTAWVEHENWNGPTGYAVHMCVAGFVFRLHGMWSTEEEADAAMLAVTRGLETNPATWWQQGPATERKPWEPRTSTPYFYRMRHPTMDAPRNDVPKATIHQGVGWVRVQDESARDMNALIVNVWGGVVCIQGQPKFCWRDGGVRLERITGFDEMNLRNSWDNDPASWLTFRPTPQDTRRLTPVTRWSADRRNGQGTAWV